MKYIIETERLYLKELHLSDAPFIVELLNSPGWLQYIGDRNVSDIKKAEEYLKNGPLKSYVELGYGLSLVVLKNSNKSVGMCGLLKREYLEHPDIGFAFLSEFMGKGYALEIAMALKQYAEVHWHVKKLCAIVQSDNDRSVKLLKKLGLSFKEKITSPTTNEKIDLYSN
ncbi:GNAT family N-acetyltransferase [Chryseotalea sanaruensis]|uniref:GNAT family N-acetyltransferase n=1 Tax=Chryseotalea sanaruensis TaxID=2482724 RepID=A0A401UA24_9BACT|nr:GNAT family N-acetyltransferase [Chryseotalea sanaruensis]GCC51731.1 GNAT family N-acetyltransferase [Chryseotalea sanaruensis]